MYPYGEGYLFFCSNQLNLGYLMQVFVHGWALPVGNLLDDFQLPHIKRDLGLWYIRKVLSKGIIYYGGNSFPLRDLLIMLFHFYLLTNQIHMKTPQTTISEVKLVYRTKVKASDRLQVKCSKDAFDIFMESWDLDSIEHIEEFKLMLLTRSNKVLGIASISKGRYYSLGDEGIL